MLVSGAIFLARMIWQPSLPCLDCLGKQGITFVEILSSIRRIQCWEEKNVPASINVKALHVSGLQMDNAAVYADGKQTEGVVVLQKMSSGGHVGYIGDVNSEPCTS